VEDLQLLALRNEHFIEACRQGSWSMLREILSPGFTYLDGSTGEVWPMDRYIADLEASPAPDLAIDQVAIQVIGSTAIVSARTSPGNNRYVDIYQRENGNWLCIHATVWPLLTR
jgi:hypothetical protein